jgi:hypothetical protein
MVFAALTGWMGGALPWWAYLMAVIGLALLVISPALVALSLNKKLRWGFSVLLSLFSLGVIAAAFGVGEAIQLYIPVSICSTCQDTRQLAFPILTMTGFLVTSSGAVKDWRTVVALILSLLIAFAITLRAEQATQGIVINGQALSLPFVAFLLPALAFSLSTLWNLSIRKALRLQVTVLSSAVVVASALMAAFGLGRVFTL